MTKSKSWMATWDAVCVCLAIDIFPGEVVEKKFLLLYLGRRSFNVVYGNRYLPDYQTKMYFLSSNLGLSLYLL